MRNRAKYARSRGKLSKSFADTKKNGRQHSSSSHFEREKRTQLMAVSLTYDRFSNLMLLRSLCERIFQAFCSSAAGSRSHFEPTGRQGGLERPSRFQARLEQLTRALQRRRGALEQTIASAPGGSSGTSRPPPRGRAATGKFERTSEAACKRTQR